ncbi:nitrous oxide reductase accessory protein NosL [Pelagibaculum spongiae]|nr:nitrous oxide reductase accessory protein NosL [Pelagibaculum spongiae]
MNKKRIISALFAVAFILGCSAEKAETQIAKAVAIESADECHLCGMIIGRFPGPKGETYKDGSSQVKKFCSTRDMLTWALDPENKAGLREVWVHDMGQTSWESPSDEQFIDGRNAWYVAGTSRMGAMGPALASFSDKSLAEVFAKNYGGDLHQFDQLSLELLSKTSMQHMKSEAGGHDMSKMKHDMKMSAADSETIDHGEMKMDAKK